MTPGVRGEGREEESGKGRAKLVFCQNDFGHWIMIRSGFNKIQTVPDLILPLYICKYIQYYSLHGNF